MKKRSYRYMAVLLAVILLATSVPSTFAVAIEEKKVYYLSECDTTESVSIPITLRNGEVGTITVSYSEVPTKSNSRASGDPATAGTHTVTFTSLLTTISYLVDINTNGDIIDAYGLDFTTIHNITSHDLSYTASRAHLYLEWIPFSVVGSMKGYLDLGIRDGCKYVETNL